MPNEFQRIMDSLLKNIPFTNCYIDDILVASRGTLEEHKSIVYKILSILDKTTWQLNGVNAHFLNQISNGLASKFLEMEYDLWSVKQTQ